MGTAAVVFDLDGTLVDSEPAYYEASRRTLAGYGVAGYGWEQHLRFVGVGTGDSVRALCAEYGIGAPASRVLADLDRRYLERAGSSAVFAPMRRLVAALRAVGMPLAVASGSSRAAIGAVLAGTGLAGCFPVAVSAEEVPRGKPAPDVFLEAARRLGVRPEACVVVEDAAPGVLAADAAGMACVAVPSVAGQEGDPAFARAGLLSPGGPEAFDADAALAWILRDAGKR